MFGVVCLLFKNESFIRKSEYQSISMNEDDTLNKTITEIKTATKSNLKKRNKTNKTII